MEISTSAKGTIGELLVAADLMRCGFEVFHGFSGRESCDLIALQNGKCWRVEVKTSDPHDPYFWMTQHKQNKYDVLAFVNLKNDAVGYADGGPDDFLAIVDQVQLARDAKRFDRMERESLKQPQQWEV